MSEVKQVIVMRKDLNMRKGKMVAQGAHASMAAIINEGYRDHGELGLPTLTIPLNKEIDQWLTGAFTKICLSVNSEEELLALYKQAQDAGLICSLIKDAGRTEFNGVPTHTCIAIGPAAAEDINTITGDLKLL